MTNATRLLTLWKKNSLAKISPALAEVVLSGDSLSVTELANLMGITKGAVSQRLKKLEKRGLTNKEEDPENISRAHVFLTSKGKSAYFAHKHWHEKMDGGYMAYYKKMDEDKINFLIEFMTQVEDFLQRAMNTNE